MTFDEMFYLQIQGTTMGTIFVPTYATLSMDYHEIELYAIIRNKFTLPVFNYFERNWRRFLNCKRFLWKFIQNQQTQRGMSFSNQTIPSIT